MKLAKCALIAACMCLLSGMVTSRTAIADASAIRLARNYGIGYLQLMLMQHDKLIQKHAHAIGLGKINVRWSQFASGSVSNDALLAGDLDVATGGIPPFVTLWSKTRGTFDVRAIAAATAYPFYLNTVDQRIKDIRDFGDEDRIAVAGAGTSIQTIFLEIATAQAFGDANYKKLDPLMVNLPNPDGMIAMLKGKQIKSNMSSIPYQYYELEKPGVRRILSSTDILGGSTTSTLIWTTAKFREQNPLLYRALFAAFKEATDIINRDNSYAADVYTEMTHSKVSTAEIAKILSDPQVEFTMVPQNTMKIVSFMYKTKRLKIKPTSWKDLFFPEVYGMPGN